MCIDAADAVVVGVGDVEVALVVEGDTVRVRDLCLGGRPAVPGAGAADGLPGDAAVVVAAAFQLGDVGSVGVDEVEPLVTAGENAICFPSGDQAMLQSWFLNRCARAGSAGRCRRR